MNKAMPSSAIHKHVQLSIHHITLLHSIYIIYIIIHIPFVVVEDVGCTLGSLLASQLPISTVLLTSSSEHDSGDSKVSAS